MRFYVTICSKKTTIMLRQYFKLLVTSFICYLIVPLGILSTVSSSYNSIHYKGIFRYRQGLTGNQPVVLVHNNGIFELRH